jgi:hypothetical protein
MPPRSKEVITTDDEMEEETHGVVVTVEGTDVGMIGQAGSSSSK